MGVNPRNPSQKVTIPAATVPKFSAGSTLKQAVKSGGGGEPASRPLEDLSREGRASGPPRCEPHAGASLSRVSAEPAVAADPVRRPARGGGRAQASPARRRASTRGPTCCRVELPGDAHLGRRRPPRRARASVDGIVDAVAPARRRASSRSSPSSRLSGPTGCARSRTSARYARSAGLLVLADGKRGDIGSTSRAYAPRTSSLTAIARARRRADREPLPRPGLARAVPRRLPARRRRALLPRQDLERGRRGRPGPRRSPTGGRSGSRSPDSCTSSARTSSASAGSRASARSSARPTRAPWARRGGCCRSRSCSSRASARRAPPRPTSPAPSRAVRRARSSTPRAASSTRSARRRGLEDAPRAGGGAAPPRGLGRLGLVAVVARLAGAAEALRRAHGVPGGGHDRGAPRALRAADDLVARHDRPSRPLVRARLRRRRRW